MTAEPTEQIAAGPVLDDIDARPGSTASLLRTLVGPVSYTHLTLPTNREV